MARDMHDHVPNPNPIVHFVEFVRLLVAPLHDGTSCVCWEHALRRDGTTGAHKAGRPCDLYSLLFTLIDHRTYVFAHLTRKIK